MKELAVALVALAVAMPALAAESTIAPPVVRKAKPAARAAPAAAPQAGRSTNPRDYQAALAAAAAQGGGDPSLDGSLVTVMSRLVAAGRCDEATTLAARDGRTELAARAKQLCR